MLINETVPSDSEPKLAAFNAPPRRTIIWLLLLVGCLHIPSLFAPFFIDDYIYMDTAHHLESRGLVDLFTTSTMTGTASSVWWTPTGVLPFYRPIAELTMVVDYMIWGLNPIGYHLTNLLLHLVCSWLAFRLGLRLFEETSTALVVATVFSIHPIHSEAVAWISGRFDLLVCICALASTLAFMRWINREGSAWRNGLTSLIWFVVGLGCKETALILPAVLIALAIIRPGQIKNERINIKPFIGWGCLFGIVAFGYLAGRFAMFGGLGHLPPPYGLDRSTIGTALSGISWNLAQYLLDFVLFIQVDAIYVADFWAANPLLFAAALLLTMVIVAICLRLAWSSRSMWLGLIWMAAFSAPCLLAMPGERNVYLASAGLAVIVAAVWKELGNRTAARPAQGRTLRRLGTAMVCLWLAMVVVEQGVMWCVAAPGDKFFRDMEALLPDPPEDAKIYVVNLCPLNAVGLNQAVKLRYGREDISAIGLTLAPTLELTTKDRVVQTGPDTITITRENGVYFGSFIEKFHLFSDPVTELPGAAERWGLTLIDPPDSYEGLDVLQFRLPHAIDDPRIQLFVWNNERIKSPIDLISVTQLASLERCALASKTPATE